MSTNTLPEETKLPRHTPYYEKHGEAHDGILRCKDCRKLNTVEYLAKHGACNCGNRKMNEVRGLSVLEWAKIRFGIIDFPRRTEFLREFNCGR